MLTHPDLKRFLTPLNITDLNNMQKESLERYDSGQDMLLLAPTGTGKTLAFFLPLIGQLDLEQNEVQALVLVPSRELALQLEHVFKTMNTGFKVNCCYGGHSMKTEMNNLMHPPAVLIGTPGRIADHLKRKSFSATGVRILVLDEFDKSLEFGFEDDMTFIVRQLPALNSRILTSATNMTRIPPFVGTSNLQVLNYTMDHSSALLELVTVSTTSAEKLETLFALICHIGTEPMLVFCNHREAVDRISELLFERGIVHEVFHGGMEQEERERALLKFRNGSHHVLITTDLASRGLDIPGISHIIHYQLPQKEDAFIHRNGRTARMNASGTAYLIITENDDQPDYIQGKTIDIQVPQDAHLPAQPEWETLYISGGKKDKINKVDIVGLFLKKGKLDKEELGLIEVKDNFSYAAVKRTRVNELLKKVNNQKLKKKKVRVQIAL
ncbi:ATP-dependent RNA helicase [Fulvivirga imtechensis AK7]|uniref:ATP-dependent RNA helicase n=1 Tax=Fulvivirga imtechensis AK7 TaxID=1237149 RepID=L8JTD4_9BACT|nr:DEAD/DEAH box helicase [Fulvivirga imtechensis]ELR70744.1 ATP-dependent RNA helicase [Fulvivirga imtechensis AK7]